MVGIDFTRASIAQREPVSLIRGQVRQILPLIHQQDSIAGCVLLATCNRTELYLHSDSSCSDGTHADNLPLDPLALLCDAVGVAVATYRPFSVARTDADVVSHLMAVASGLESQIVGDDQIITQVREAAALAQELRVSDSVLDTLFRHAVTAGKQVKTETRLVNVPTSAAEIAIQKAEQHLGGMQGKWAVVIGNGEMGRLAAAALHQRGASVTVTLRSYHHGETVVPAGCATYPYEQRYEAIEGADVVISATTSPHCTITAAGLQALSAPPPLLIDLAIPRDIEQAAAADPRVTIWNLDDLGSLEDANAEGRAVAERIIAEKAANFTAWLLYRKSLPLIEQMKDAVTERVRYDHAFAALYQEQDTDGLVELAVNKTIDLLLGGMKEVVSPARLQACLDRIQSGKANSKSKASGKSKANSKGRTGVISRSISRTTEKDGNVK